MINCKGIHASNFQRKFDSTILHVNRKIQAKDKHQNLMLYNVPTYFIKNRQNNQKF
jgi:hypothetical protein